MVELSARFRNEGHVQAVSRCLESLDLSSLYDCYRGSGSEAYPPELMLAVALFLILIGEGSPSQWCKFAGALDQCKLLGRGITPSRTAWYDFRDRAGKFVHLLHHQLISGAIDEQLVDASDGCLDGTSIKASASRHKTFRINQLSKRLQFIKRTIAKLDDATQVASKKPLDVIPGWVAKTPLGRQRQLNQYRAAKLKILDEIRVDRSLPASLRRIEKRIVVSPADSEAVVGKDKLKVTRPLYNIQYMCDFTSDVILAYGVFQKKNDTGTLLPMIQSTQHHTHGRLLRVHADMGYCSLLELEDAQRAHVELFAPVPSKAGSKAKPTIGKKVQLGQDQFIWDASAQVLSCPAGHAMRQVSRTKDPRADNRYVIELRFEQSEAHCGACPLASACLANGSQRRTARRLEKQDILEAQTEKMKSEEAKEGQRRRKIQVERRFADSKAHRDGDQCHGRGLERVTAEIGLLVMAQNCLVLYNLEKSRALMVA